MILKNYKKFVWQLYTNVLPPIRITFYGEIYEH